MAASKKKEKREGSSRLRCAIELTAFSFLLALLISPGIFYTNIIAHELYHYAKHQDIAEEICIDINKPYLGHVKVVFENEEDRLEYMSGHMDKEERNAQLFGHAASAMYIINAIVVVNWMLILIVRSQKGR